MYRERFRAKRFARYRLRAYTRYLPACAPVYRGVEAPHRWGPIPSRRSPAVWFSSGRGNIYREWVETAFVPDGQLAVDVHVRLPVYRPEMQQGLLAFGIRRERESLLIPKQLVFPNGFANAAEGGFDGKGNENLPFPSFRAAGIAGREGVVPEPVEVFPEVPRSNCGRGCSGNTLSVFSVSAQGW